MKSLVVWSKIGDNKLKESDPENFGRILLSHYVRISWRKSVLREDLGSLAALEKDKVLWNFSWQVFGDCTTVLYFLQLCRRRLLKLNQKIHFWPTWFRVINIYLTCFLTSAVVSRCGRPARCLLVPILSRPEEVRLGRGGDRWRGRREDQAYQNARQVSQGN